MKLPYEMGTALILVIILLTVISLLMVHMFNQSLLALNMSRYLNKQIIAFEASEQKLNRVEQTVLEHQDGRETSSSAEAEPATKSQLERGRVSVYVPDHLEFGCTEGVYIIQISVPKITSFVVKRN